MSAIERASKALVVMYGDLIESSCTHPHFTDDVLCVTLNPKAKSRDILRVIDGLMILGKAQTVGPRCFEVKFEKENA